ncbi:peroxiredoxin family protein [Alterisphingorhabdus coralli]|uniref:thioredoxin-dependent peroxiredoxin n=1 Tax=Alterisphingorhabdus coralli TaxID=3071408 RepID=A0AA97F7R6_9SPHN|nr:peroxiredoxin family protein [Parasphingorhabdus sp. SCSIO 66989]WOE74827.1 peroxiredoxin family protein [Parasphingorhabdus sp. SCSIO 66989]
MHKLAIPTCLLAATALLGACGETTEQSTPEAEQEVEDIIVEDQPGPAIGDRAPVDLELANAAGETASVASLADEKGTVLVFTRSVDWCPYCQAQLKGLKEIAEDVANSGYTLAGVSYDPTSSLAKFAEDQEVDYMLLSDEGSKLIDAFNIRDPQYADPESRAYGVPYASIFVLDAEGVVLAKSVSADYKVRPTNEEIKKLIESVG